MEKDKAQIIALTTERWVLELYRTIIETLQGIAWMLLVFFLCSLVAYVVVIGRDRTLRRYRIFGRWWRPEWARLKQIMVIGTPISLTVLAEAGLFSGAALLMGRFGETELAAHTLALNLAALAFQIPFGTAQAATIRVGYHHGAGDRVAAGRAGWVALVIGTGFMSTTALAMLLVPTALLRVYIDPDAPANAALVAFALQYLMWAAIFQLADGVQAVGAGALRGLQDTRVPMWIAIFSYWVPGFGLAIWLGFYTPLEGTGVWIGLATGLFFAAALLLGVALQLVSEGRAGRQALGLEGGQRLQLPRRTDREPQVMLGHQRHFAGLEDAFQQQDRRTDAGLAQFQRFFDGGHAKAVGLAFQCLRTAHRTVAIGIGLEDRQRLATAQFTGQAIVAAQCAQVDQRAGRTHVRFSCCGAWRYWP